MRGACRRRGAGGSLGLTCACGLARADMDPAGGAAERLLEPPAGRLLQVREAGRRGEGCRAPAAGGSC